MVCLEMFSVFVSITQFSDFLVMSYENWKHILGVFSFQNSIFNDIFVIKQTWRDPLVRSAAPFDPFFSFLLLGSVSSFSLLFFFFFIFAKILSVRSSFFFGSSSQNISNLQFFLSFFLFFFFFFFFHWVRVSRFLLLLLSLGLMSFGFLVFFFFFSLGSMSLGTWKK